MPSHKSEDYKITSVKFHLENENIFVNTCKCKKLILNIQMECIVYYKTTS